MILVTLLVGYKIAQGVPTSKVDSPIDKPIVESKWIGEALDKALTKYNTPALYAAVATPDGIFVASRGIRMLGKTAKADFRDKVRIASITKPFTAAMIMKLNEKSKLSTSDTISKLYPEAVGLIDPGYEKTPILDFLLHRSGATNVEPPEMASKSVPPGAKNYAPAGVQFDRFGYMLRLLQVAPSKTKGKYAYSNPAYVVLAAISERATGSEYEDLVERYVFNPLGLKSAGFGMPGHDGQLDQPAYHPYDKGVARRIFEGSPVNDQGRLAASQGGIHLSIGDLARFGWAFVAAFNGKPIGFSAQTYQTMMTPSAEVATRTPVWEVVQTSSMGQALEHTGQNGDSRGNWSNSILTLSPERRIVVAVATNRGEAWQCLYELRDALAKEAQTRISK